MFLISFDVNDPESTVISAAGRMTLSTVTVRSARPLDFRPGERSAYSSSGYALLAFVIE